MDSLNLCRTGLQAGSVGAQPWRAVAALLALVWLSACSAIPDELNPIEWANDVDAYLSGEEAESDPELAARIEAERAQPVPGADQDFPKLSSVPGQAPTVTSYDERTEITERLVADRAATRYVENPATLTGAENAPVPAPTVTSTPAISTTDVDRTVNMRAPDETAAMAALVSSDAPRVPTVSTPPLQTVTPRFSDAEMAELAWAGNLEGLLHAAVIYYANGSSRLSRRDREVLRQVAEVQKLDGAIVRVVGHASMGSSAADSVKVKIANFEIAYDRARAVADELIKLGVPEDRVFVASASDSQPAYSESTPNGAAANRRTDIYFENDRSPA